MRVLSRVAITRKLPMAMTSRRWQMMGNDDIRDSDRPKYNLFKSVFDFFKLFFFPPLFSEIILKKKKKNII